MADRAGAGDSVTGLVTLTFSKEMVPTMVAALRAGARAVGFTTREVSWLLDWADDLAPKADLQLPARRAGVLGRSVPLGPRAGTARAELGEATCNGRMGLLPPLGGDYGASENPANTVSRIFCDQDFRAGTEDKTPGHGACGPEGSEGHLVE